MAKVVVGAEVRVDGLSKAASNVGNFRKQLKEATEDLVTMSEKFGLSSKEAQNAAKKVAGLKDAIGDAKALSETFNPDKKFVALGGALQGVTAGFSAFSGAMGVLGADSKKTEELLLKVQSAMALQQGISGIMGAVDSFKLLGNTIKGNVTKAFGTLKGAIISTGIGALIIGVGLLIANFDSVKKAVLNLIPGLAKVGEFIGKLVDGFTDFIGVTSAAERAQEKFLKSTEESIKRQEQFLDANSYKFDDFTNRKLKARLELTRKYEELEKNEGKLSESEKLRQKREYEEKYNFEIKQAGTDRQKTYDDAAKTESDKAAGAAKAKNDRLAGIEKGNAEKAAEAEKQRVKDLAELKKGLNTKDEINDDLAIMKEQFDELDQAEIERAQGMAAARVQLGAETFDTLQKQREEDLKNEKILAEQKQQLAQQTGAALSALSDLVGKETAAGKALAVASALINTYQGIAAGVKLGFPAAIPAVIAASATGFAAVRNILKTKVPGKSGGGSSPSIGSIAAPITPQAQTTTLDQNSINAVGNAANRAYVLESDVSGNQDRIRRLNRAARIN